LIAWARKTFDIEINVSDSVLSPTQSIATKEKLAEVMKTLSSWELAGTQLLWPVAEVFTDSDS
jgi:ATP synthase F1 complex assembly factor 2